MRSAGGQNQDHAYDRRCSQNSCCAAPRTDHGYPFLPGIGKSHPAGYKTLPARQRFRLPSRAPGLQLAPLACPVAPESETGQSHLTPRCNAPACSLNSHSQARILQPASGHSKPGPGALHLQFYSNVLSPESDMSVVDQHPRLCYHRPSGILPDPYPFPRSSGILVAERQI